jgi:hypothetical protein
MAEQTTLVNRIKYLVVAFSQRESEFMATGRTFDFGCALAKCAKLLANELQLTQDPGDPPSAKPVMSARSSTEP